MADTPSPKRSNARRDDQRRDDQRGGDRRGGDNRRGGDARRGQRDDEDAAMRALRAKLSGVLRRLPDIERKVLELRMGLAEGVPLKPGEVASRLGMSIAEVKRIETRAFERIREVGPIKGLERFLER